MPLVHFFFFCNLHEKCSIRSKLGKFTQETRNIVQYRNNFKNKNKIKHFEKKL